MSEPKAQLVDPQGNMNLPGMNATGVITASSFSGSGGVVTGLTGGGNLNVGVVTATSFVGDGTGHAANLTGTPNLNLGLTTATSFIGDATGKAAGLTGTPNLNVGLITATSFAGAVTGDVTGNITGLAASITPGNNLNVGVATGIQWHGDGSNLTGAGSSASIAQEILDVNAGEENIIDLSYGNLIYYDGNSNATVGFASTSPAEQITFIRKTGGSYTTSYATGGVDFDGTDDALTLAASTDFQWDGDFTVEWWGYRTSSGGDAPFGLGAYQVEGGVEIFYHTNGTILLYTTNGSDSATRIIGSTGWVLDAWQHVAVVRSGTTVTLYIDGVDNGSYTESGTFGAGSNNSLTVGCSLATSGGSLTTFWDGKISNFRVVKGTAVYTGDFIPPRKPLANITNTKLLCCKDTSSATTAEVTPGTITAVSSPTAGAQTISLSGTFSGTKSITWPSTVKWNNDITPTLVSDSQSSAFQIFHLTTGDTGASYQAWEEMKNDPVGPFELYGWGSGGIGLLGLNDTTQRSSPTQLGTEDTWASGASRNWFESTLAGFVKTDGTAWIWGKNQGGTLGQNESYAGRYGYSSPTQIPGTTWSTITTGDYNVLLTKTDGTLWGFGLNEAGGLGLNDAINRSSPTQIGTATHWGSSQITTTGASACVIKSDNTMWAWGSAWGGALGLNSWTSYSSPMQVGTDATWSNMRVGGTRLAVKTTGTLWSWGYVGNGMSGLNVNNSRYSSPTQIGTDSDWSSKISVGSGEVACIKTDGSLWMWGGNGYGNLAQNNNTARSSPIQVGTSTTWSDIAIGMNYSVSTKTDGALWTWGFNHAMGTLGNNTSFVDLSSPIQVPGTWTDPNVSRQASWALKKL